MCFYTDDAETFEVCEESTVTLEAPASCPDCGRKIPAGQLMHEFHFQKYEECHDCEVGDCGCADGKCCQCAQPNYGEAAQERRCHDCHLLRECVREVEHEAGCDAAESEPLFGQLRHSLRQANPEDVERYLARARQKYPELRAYLDWFAGQLRREEGA